jgi:hypothetical protein
VHNCKILRALQAQGLKELAWESGIAETSEKNYGAIENGRDCFLNCLESFIYQSAPRLV